MFVLRVPAAHTLFKPGPDLHAGAGVVPIKPIPAISIFSTRRLHELSGGNTVDDFCERHEGYIGHRVDSTKIGYECSGRGRVIEFLNEEISYGEFFLNHTPKCLVPREPRKIGHALNVLELHNLVLEPTR